ncbi:MAG: hypothetical protein KBA81_05065 [Rhabdochlamydiaceae bacterium]|nr:hypothetical protein [Rhabdochlamydiaceae bacterium]
MTKRFSSSLLLSTCLLTTALSGWGNSDYVPPSVMPTPGPTLDVTTFPLNEDQEWFVKPSLLIWRPYQDDIDTGFSLKTPSNAPVTRKDKTQNVHFDWGTGVRLNIGRYLPNHDQWDITFNTTFFYSDTHQTVHGHGFGSTALSDLVTISDGWNPELLGTSFKTHFNWRINYFTWDLAAGRLYNLTPKFVIHPYICLRTMLTYEKYTNKNLSAFNTGTFLTQRETTFKAYNSVWGIGPRLGTDFMFEFGRRWSFLGGLSGSIVMGRNHIREKIHGFIFGDGASPSTPTFLKISDADTVMRANIEGNIGLGWEKWVRNHSVRIAPSLMFEVTEWFMINNWVSTNLPSTTGSPDWGMISARRMGDLGFLGFTLNLQVDF